MDIGDNETIRMAKKMVVLRTSTKHNNMWIRQLDMKEKEFCDLTGLIGIEEIKKEICEEKSMERWARRCTNFFTRNVKRMLFGRIDNMVWSGSEKEVSRWGKRNKVSDEITEKEIEEIESLTGSEKRSFDRTPFSRQNAHRPFGGVPRFAEISGTRCPHQKPIEDPAKASQRQEFN